MAELLCHDPATIRGTAGLPARYTADEVRNTSLKLGSSDLSTDDEFPIEEDHA